MKNFEELSNLRQRFAVKRGFVGFFVSRDSVQEALDYAGLSVSVLHPRDHAGILTAIAVLVNTFALEVANTGLIKRFCLEELGMAEDDYVEHINHFLTKLVGEDKPNEDSN